MPAHFAIRLTLAIAGVAIIFLGLNVGLGGIRTLGWQGAGAFIDVTDPLLYGTRDNHIRFIGGVWLGLGMAMLAGAFALGQFRTTLLVFIGMIFIGGLARFSALDMTTLSNASVAPSLVLELLAFPLLGLWLARSVPAKTHG